MTDETEMRHDVALDTITDELALGPSTWPAHRRPDGWTLGAGLLSWSRTGRDRSS